MIVTRANDEDTENFPSEQDFSEKPDISYRQEMANDYLKNQRKQIRKPTTTDLLDRQNEVLDAVESFFEAVEDKDPEWAKDEAVEIFKVLREVVKVMEAGRFGGYG